MASSDRAGVPALSLLATAYWFAYFLVVLPILGVIEKPTTPPATIEDDYNAHYRDAETPPPFAGRAAE